MTTDAADRIARLERQVELLLARIEILEAENAELRRVSIRSSAGAWPS